MSGDVLVHLAVGARPFALFAGGHAHRGWVAAGPEAGLLAHGVCDPGAVVTLDGDPDVDGAGGLVRALLDALVTGDEAAVAAVIGGPGARTARLRVVRPGDFGPAAPSSGVSDVAAMAAAASALRDRPRPRGPRVRSVLSALLRPGEPPAVLLGLGSQLSAVPFRVWPGLVAAPPAGPAGPAHATLGEVAGCVDDLVAAGRLDPADVAAVLAGAQDEALAEAGHAERQAALMDSHGDDAGGMVRRLVAQIHAATLADAALRRLAGEPGDPSL